MRPSVSVAASGRRVRRTGSPLTVADRFKVHVMGCVQSRTDEPEQRNGTKDKAANSKSAHTNANSAQSAPGACLDPRLPLNARQKYSMMASWKGISRAMEPTGVYMFIK